MGVNLKNPVCALAGSGQAVLTPFNSICPSGFRYTAINRADLHIEFDFVLVILIGCSTTGSRCTATNRADWYIGFLTLSSLSLSVFPLVSGALPKPLHEFAGADLRPRHRTTCL